MIRVDILPARMALNCESSSWLSVRDKHLAAPQALALATKLQQKCDYDNVLRHQFLINHVFDRSTKQRHYPLVSHLAAKFSAIRDCGIPKEVQDVAPTFHISKFIYSN